MTEDKSSKSIFNVDSIYRDIDQFGTIRVKHRVNLFSKDKAGKNVPYGKIYVSQKSNGGIIGYPSVAFRETKDSLILESGYVFEKDNPNSVRKPKSVMISYDDVGEIKRCFNEAYKWFTSDPWKNELFKYDEKTGIPYGIAQKYESLNSTCNLKSGMRGAFLAIKPTTVSDPLNSIGYPGVVLIGQQGLIGSCTMTEFFSMRDVVLTNVTNLYQISLELVNQYLLGQIGGKHNG